MSGRAVGSSIHFRKSFQFAHKEVTHYFPGHMAKGMNQMQHRLKDVDAIIEVHDARHIPFSGRNPSFKETLAIRPHLLVLNKMDLTDLSLRQHVSRQLEEQGVHQILYTNCKQQFHQSVKYQLIPLVLSMLKDVPRYHRTDASDYNLLVIGVPNVGKSSLINALRRTHLKKGRATRVGGEAGITRSVLEKIKISEKPRIYVYDSPGILAPNITDLEAGLKLALCATLKDHLVGEDIIADYLLYWMNRHRQFNYVHHLGLTQPTDNIHELLTYVAKKYQAVIKLKSTAGGYVYKPHLIRAAQLLIRDFREGRLGKVNLDIDSLSDTRATDGS